MLKKKNLWQLIPHNYCVSCPTICKNWRKVQEVTWLTELSCPSRSTHTSPWHLVTSPSIFTAAGLSALFSITSLLTLWKRDQREIYDRMYLMGSVNSWREVRMEGLLHLTHRWLQSSRPDRSTDQSRCRRSHRSDKDSVQSSVPHIVLQDRLKSHTYRHCNECYLRWVMKTPIFDCRSAEAYQAQDKSHIYISSLFLIMRKKESKKWNLNKGRRVFLKSKYTEIRCIRRN